MSRHHPLDVAVRWALGIRYFSGLLEGYLPDWAAKRFYPARGLPKQVDKEGHIEHAAGDRSWITYNPEQQPLWLWPPTPDREIDTPVEEWLAGVGAGYPSQLTGKLKYVAQKALALDRGMPFDYTPERTHGLYCSAGGKYAIIEIGINGAFVWPIEFARESHRGLTQEQFDALPQEEKDRYNFAPKRPLVDPYEVVLRAQDLKEGRKLQIAPADILRDQVYKDPVTGEIMGGICREAGWAFRSDGHEAQLVLTVMRQRGSSRCRYTYRFKATFMEGSDGLPYSVHFSKIDEGWLCSGRDDISIIRIPRPEVEGSILMSLKLVDYYVDNLPPDSICPVYVFYDGMSEVLVQHHWGRTAPEYEYTNIFGGGSYPDGTVGHTIPGCPGLSGAAWGQTMAANAGSIEESSIQAGIYAYFSCTRSFNEQDTTRVTRYYKEEYKVLGEAPGSGERVLCNTPGGTYMLWQTNWTCIQDSMSVRIVEYSYFHCLVIPLREREAVYQFREHRTHTFPYRTYYADGTAMSYSSPYLAGGAPPGDTVGSSGTRSFVTRSWQDFDENQVEDRTLWLIKAGTEGMRKWKHEEIDPVLTRDLFDPDRGPNFNVYVGAYSRKYIALPNGVPPETTLEYPIAELQSLKLAFIGDEATELRPGGNQ